MSVTLEEIYATVSRYLEQHPAEGDQQAPLLRALEAGQDVTDRAQAANPAKGEPEHWHADVRFVFRVGEPQVSLQYDEVIGWTWRPRTDAPTPKLAAKLANV